MVAIVVIVRSGRRRIESKLRDELQQSAIRAAREGKTNVKERLEWRNAEESWEITRNGNNGR
jgi:hypothetical protein